MRSLAFWATVMSPLLIALASSSTHGGDAPQARSPHVVTYEIGPVDLSAQGGHHSMIHSSLEEVFSPMHPRREIRVAQDGWLVAFTPTVADARGRVLPGSLLHHAMLVNVGAASSTASPPPLIYWGVGTGSEMTAFHVPAGYGLPVKAGDRLEMVCMFDNPHQVTHQDVVCQAHLTFQSPQADVPDPRSLVTVWLKVDPGDGYGYWVSPGAHERSQLVQFPFSGTVVYMAAHLHAHARSFTVEETDPPRTVWVATPNQSADGQLTRVPTWSSPAGWRVTADGRYRLTARYDNPTNSPIDAMGVLGAFMAPDDVPHG